MKPDSKIKNQKSKIRSAFTLVELLIVISIITIMLGLGLLAFNALTGRKSTAMARNQVAAMLGKARSVAVNYDVSGSSRSFGVMFFRDPETERTAMAIAIRYDTGGGDPDPHDNYKGWSTGVAYQPGDRVVAVVRDDVDGAAMAVRFRCLLANTTPVGSPGNPTRPAPFRQVNTAPPLVNPAYPFWEEVLEAGIGFPDEPLEFLPVGVSVQLITDPGTIEDRYVRTGAIFFDRRGQMDHLSFYITPGSPVGMRMGLSATIPSITGTFYSAVGLAIYDSQTFTAQASNSEDDYSLLAWIPGHPRPTAANETAEEVWIDNNANLLTVNRYSGELSQIR